MRRMERHRRRWNNRRSRQRHYDTPAGRRRRYLWLLGVLACGGILIFSAVQLINYAVDYVQSRRAAQELREIYYEETPVAEQTPLPTPTYTPLPTAIPASTPVPGMVNLSGQRTPENTNTLPTVRYPGNASARVSSRFQKIQRQNSDIIGWLTIEDLVDEAVVQRDNTYYLKRDYRGYHNANGAIFLDENCELKTRPYTLILYGHNMKTGAMFGGLRNYENIVYYKNSPFITFDTAYEDGRYVIFSISTISTKTADRNFLDFIKLQSDIIPWRQEAIDSLIRQSIFTNYVDVQPDDQLLLLVTCVDDDDERRVVAARRVREGESESTLKTQVSKSRKR